MNNTIPVKDVTEEATREEVFAEVSRVINVALDKGPAPVLFVRLVGEPDERFSLDVSAMALDNEMEMMVTGMVTMMGQSLLGEQVSTMPPELVQSISLATGLRHLQQRLQKRLQPQATPAGDAAKPH